ncbi:DUF1850 domain-containing protein [Microvirga alba]|uniref:DUF1850 domain-containing protein n=1 Tax=Microvirga alba TaxID=2791025 RepID=A0A931BXQ0_9HYPH|nr:DUF1850 domain-containing protein [Microvirga alba]MBF9234737.1 DUF1850 domain-containing protein [Microvirga alba]
MICLVAGSTIAPLLAGAITLAWTHSVEKIVWEEDWRSGPAGLELVEARVRGSGAGMEPQPEARFVNGIWKWHPTLAPQREVILRRSGATADWRICISAQCRPMEAYVPAAADPVVMKVCDGF